MQSKYFFSPTFFPILVKILKAYSMPSYNILYKKKKIERKEVEKKKLNIKLNILV